MAGRRLINRMPGRQAAIFLAALPFVLVIAAYMTVASSACGLPRTRNDKLLPSFC